MILLAAFLAAAAPHDPRCDSVTTPDLILCAQAEHDRADAALNAQWRKALATVKGWEKNTSSADKAANGNVSYSQALLSSQRAWLAYRDSECKFQIYGNAGGRELPIYRLGCLTGLTKQRTKQLQDDFTEGR